MTIMLSWIPLLLAVLMVFFLERPGEQENKILAGVIYFFLGIFPLDISGFLLPVGLPTVVMLLIRRIDNRVLKIVAALAGAAAGWIYFVWLRPPGT